MEPLKSRLQKNGMDAYLAGGRSQNNLWLVYGDKSSFDWILPND